MIILKKKERGMALLASLIVLVVITTLGLTVANKGLVLEKITRSEIRYEEIANVAEIAMRQTIQKLDLIDEVISFGDMSKDKAKKVNLESKASEIVQVWSPKALRAKFSDDPRNGSVSRTDFSDFNEKGWEFAISNKDIASDDDSSYGYIKTYTFIEQVITEQSDKYDTSGANYLITVKAAARNPGSKENEFVEKIVIQTLYAKRFNTTAIKSGVSKKPK